MKKKIWIGIVIGIIFLISLFVIPKFGLFDKGSQILNIKDDRGLYKLNDSRSIYSDMENPKMILNGEVVSVKDINKTNCTASCIHNYSEPIEILRDGGSKIYEYEVENEKYYIIECHKTNSKYNNGSDVIISKEKDKLANWC